MSKEKIIQLAKKVQGILPTDQVCIADIMLEDGV